MIMIPKIVEIEPVIRGNSGIVFQPTGITLRPVLDILPAPMAI
jgi:hypothetical protein